MGVVTGWTGHTPTPGDGPTHTVGGVGVAYTQCKYCTLYVRPVWRMQNRQKTQSWMHVDFTPSDGFTAEKAKELHEDLDAVWASLDEGTRVHLLLSLATIAVYAHHNEMWKTVQRWSKNKEDQ